MIQGRQRATSCSGSAKWLPASQGAGGGGAFKWPSERRGAASRQEIEESHAEAKEAGVWVVRVLALRGSW